MLSVHRYNIKTYYKWNVQPYFSTYKMDQNVVCCNIKGLHMHQNFVLDFWISLTYSFSVQVFVLMGFCIFVMLLWFIEFVRFFDMHKMDWIVQKWSTIPINMPKFYKIKWCQAFLAVMSSFKSHCLYAYSYFCGLEHL